MIPEDQEKAHPPEGLFGAPPIFSSDVLDEPNDDLDDSDRASIPKHNEILTEKSSQSPLALPKLDDSKFHDVDSSPSSHREELASRQSTAVRKLYDEYACKDFDTDAFFKSRGIDASDDYDDEDVDAWEDECYCYDGFWTYDGHMGLLMGLDDPDIVEDEYEEFLDEKEEDPSLVEEEEFVTFDYDPDDSEDFVRFTERLWERRLWVASGVTNRHRDGGVPVRLRIRRLHEEIEFKPMMAFKKRGNAMFGKQKYQDAIRLYDEALALTGTDLFVMPYDQMEQVVQLLSNRAECELRLGMYNEAGQTATDALVFLRDHEKTRIRRAKAGLAIAQHTDFEKPILRMPYLVQAKKDLVEALDLGDDFGDYCETTIQEIDRELEGIKLASLQENPRFDWEYQTLLARSYCR